MNEWIPLPGDQLRIFDEGYSVLPSLKFPALSDALYISPPFIVCLNLYTRSFFTHPFLFIYFNQLHIYCKNIPLYFLNAMKFVAFPGVILFCAMG